MEAHCRNAMALAEFLEEHPAVEDVIYPGLKSHPQHDLANRQMKKPGGMISLRLKGGTEETNLFLSKLKLFTLAESLGGIESLVEVPAVMTHASIAPEIRQQLGITDSLIRMSVGIEDLDDLKVDLERGLNAVQKSSRAAA